VAARIAKLKDQLQMGDKLTTEEKNQLEQVLLSQSDVFALTDEELGETNLVTHSINTGDAKHCLADYHMCYGGNWRKK